MQSMNKQSKEGRKAISEATPIQIGLVLIIVGGFASWIWWAATISSKLDTVLKFQQVQDSSITSLRADLNTLTRDFKVHEASTKKDNQ
jgi:cytoskeletal protein RodZ